MKQRTTLDFIRQKEHQDNGKESDEDNLDCAAVGCIVNDEDAMRKVKTSKNVIWFCYIICEELYHTPCVGLDDCTEKEIEET